MTIRNYLLEVHHQRLAVESLRNALRTAREKWDAENMELIGAVRDAEMRLLDKEGLLRGEAVALYERTGDKEIGPGVGIRVLTKLSYNMEKALNWARQAGVALTLDVKAFERIAKESAIPGVEIERTEVPQATIAQNLGPILAREEAPHA